MSRSLIKKLKENIIAGAEVKLKLHLYGINYQQDFQLPIMAWPTFG